MKNKDNIEKLFKETFEHFEAEVNPQVWSNIQNGIKSIAGSSGSVAAKFTTGKIILGAVSIAIVTGSFWYLVSSNQNSNTTITKQQVQTEIIPNPTVTNSKDIPQNIISENQPTNGSFNLKDNSTALNSSATPSAHSLNHYPSDYSQQIQTTEASSGNKTSTESFATEDADNTSLQSPLHRYGKGSEGPSSLIRGNLKQPSKTASSKKNISEDNQEAEQAPNANIWTSSESGDAPFSVNFGNQGISSSLSWNFGDGSTSRENSPSHTFEKPGNYVVRLTSKNSFGSSIDKITIEVKSISGIEHAPNVFSPNGDGENDLFFLGLKNISAVEVIISDLSARTVGGWNAVDGSWNGKLKNGDDAPEGLYFYTIQAIGTDGVNHSKKGSISLNRKR